MLSESSKNRFQQLAGIQEAGGTPRNMSYASKYSAKYRNNSRYPFHKNEQEQPDINEISPGEVDIPKQYLHDVLNKKIWNGEQMRSEVRTQLLRIAHEFYQYLDVKAKIKAIKVIGSMANFNWTSQSDIDLHLFFDLSEVGKDKELAQNYFNAAKNLWKNDHNITVKGFPVELYAQDINDQTISSGVYDLVKDTWESKPTIENFNPDKNALTTKIVSLANEIEELEKAKKNAETADKAQKLKDKIKRMRQCGLEKGGEFSIENLAFKYLRNHGFLDKLYTISSQAIDASLSLKEDNKKNEK